MLCNFTHALCIFIYFNSFNLQNTNILHFSSVVGVFYVVFSVCFKYTILLLFITHSVTDYVRECENFSVFLFLVIQCHCIKLPHSIVRFIHKSAFSVNC